MTPVTVYDVGPMGDTTCADCGHPVYIAWDDEMNRIALEPDDNGPVAVSLDGNRLPWCRDTHGSQLAFDDRFYRLHGPERCAALAVAMVSVRVITTARSVRQPRRPAATGRRLASAR